MTPGESILLHASCIAIGGRGVLISGPSGSGKSDLALRLIDRGATLVSDDYVLVHAKGGRLVASAPERIAGKIEIRGLGLIHFPALDDVPVCLLADLERPIERLPEPGECTIVAGLSLPVVSIRALEASAPIKLEMALIEFGLKIL
ncbi:HPr kinase/phosphorylase [Sphingosinicella rhizophila]|uniref:HPr kinase/phosphatase C-terminal domain-containing protein n=1 Tax=Sphingosinicella rhizophila TaxID=3050082 RepID=A0ABU3Q2V6_9SPHN|nr:HPr kinase/phosphatase C-terminal domain-containing protein [Sphingosinicella sp. GR2756]MDT9597741.1 HPr kinase/phosphatase C-terminal domain-containing protein [Sphingosinicella sp. GR2756]